MKEHRELREVSYAVAVAELVHLSGWSREDVIRQPSDASWQAAAFVQQCRRKVEAGDKR